MWLNASPASNVRHSDAFGELLLQPWQLAELLDKVHRFLQAAATRMRRQALVHRCCWRTILSGGATACEAS
jgi:hypothetical protein